MKLSISRTMIPEGIKTEEMDRNVNKEFVDLHLDLGIEAMTKIENEGEISHYNAEISAYSAEVNAKVGEQAQNIATETLRYQWVQDRHTAYTQEYYAAFMSPGGGGG